MAQSKLSVIHEDVTYLWRHEERPHLSVGRRGVSYFVGHVGEDGDEPALTVKLLSETSTDAAQQSGQ